MAQKITAMKRKRVLAAIGALALSAVATNSHAYGISYISAYTPCVNYSAGVARADLIGSIPGWTVEEIHWAYLYPQMFDNNLWVWIKPGWLNSGWQFNQAAVSYSYSSPNIISQVHARGVFYTYNYTLQFYTTYGEDRSTSMLCF